MTSLGKVICCSVFATFLGSCGLPRNAVPNDFISETHLQGMPQIRYWDIQYNPDVSIQSIDSSDCSFLALSGGGANGAFGAGFLCGWTQSGARPNFRIVTGVSTGALIAPLAFLGLTHDDTLKKYYTSVRTRDIFDVEGLLGFGVLPLLTGESYASTKPLQRLVAELLDENTIREIAQEHARGRRVYIGTTNLDAQRFVIWDMGAIASSGHPDSLKLFRKIMLASASIPGAFPPVYFDVEVNGKKYDEMHVDGGVITEVFGYGRVLTSRQLPRRQVPCSIYVIRNGKLDTEAAQVPRRVIPIVTRSFETLMKSHSWNDLYRLYATAKENGVDFNYVSIPITYESHAKEMFDPVEMKRLFDLGFDMAKNGHQWGKGLPGMHGSSNDWLWTP